MTPQGRDTALAAPNGLGTMPRHECDECHAVGSSEDTHGRRCSRYGACVLCGLRFTGISRTVRSAGGGRECFYGTACRERQTARAS